MDNKLIYLVSREFDEIGCFDDMDIALEALLADVKKAANEYITCNEAWWHNDKNMLVSVMQNMYTNMTKNGCMVLCIFSIPSDVYDAWDFDENVDDDIRDYAVKVDDYRDFEGSHQIILDSMKAWLEVHG